MASSSEIEATYDYMDELWRVSLGENADITAALYDGDYSKSLDQAQRDKHDYILASIRFRPDARVIDIGCGWGGFLRTVQQRGGRGVGLTLSPKQATTCQRSGLEVHLKDWKTLEGNPLGRFDAVVSVGAFEHFCSEVDYVAGKQDGIYRDFFRICANLLPKGGRLYLQTMLWDAKVPDPQTITLDAKSGSDEYILALLRKFYPGSWLPNGPEQIYRAAHPYFSLVSLKNGRLDYIHTMEEWGNGLRTFSLRKVPAVLRAAQHIVRDKDFRYKLESIWRGCNRECFRRELMDHQRIVLEKCGPETLELRPAGAVS